MTASLNIFLELLQTLSGLPVIKLTILKVFELDGQLGDDEARGAMDGRLGPTLPHARFRGQAKGVRLGAQALWAYRLVKDKANYFISNLSLLIQPQQRRMPLLSHTHPGMRRARSSHPVGGVLQLLCSGHHFESVLEPEQLPPHCGDGLLQVLFRLIDV
jgi:hypothetical protein